jgi:S1-C subfamily serine protease
MHQICSIVVVVFLLLIGCSESTAPKLGEPTPLVQISNIDKELAKLLKSLRQKPELLQEIERRANQGDLVATKVLGFIYIQGKFVGKDIALGVQYFKVAAERDDREAIAFLAKFLNIKNTTWYEPNEAKKWAAKVIPNATSAATAKIEAKRYETAAFNWPKITMPQENPRGFGSGVAINGGGDFLTNKHVVESCTKVFVRYNGQFTSGRVVFPKEDKDIALISVGRETPHNIIVRKTLVPLGERIYVGGYPLIDLVGSQIKITEGLVSGVDFVKNGIIQISASVSSGNSGGPVIDETGQLVGLATFTIPGGEISKNLIVGHGLSFAVHAEYAKYFMRMNGVRFNDLPRESSSYKTAALASLLSRSTALIICY